MKCLGMVMSPVEGGMECEPVEVMGFVPAEALVFEPEAAPLAGTAGCVVDLGGAGVRPTVEAMDEEMPRGRRPDNTKGGEREAQRKRDQV